MLRTIRLATIALSLLASPLLAQDVGIALGEKGPGGPLETLDGKPVDPQPRCACYE